jgi:hypothetical protein
MHFYLTDNNCVNARFLSRYIARKLQQGSFLKQLLNPIKKELLFLMKISLIPQVLYYNKVYKKYYISKSYYIAKKGFYKSFIYTIYFIYKLIIDNYFKKNKIYYTIDMLVKIIFIYDHIINNKTINNNHVKNIYYNKIYSYSYSNIIYVSIFDYKLLINNLIKLFVPKYNTAIKSNSKEKFDGLLTFVYRSLYVNRLSLVKYL